MIKSHTWSIGFVLDLILNRCSASLTFELIFKNNRDHRSVVLHTDLAVSHPGCSATISTRWCHSCLMHCGHHFIYSTVIIWCLRTGDVRVAEGHPWTGTGQKNLILYRGLLSSFAIGNNVPYRSCLCVRTAITWSLWLCFHWQDPCAHPQPNPLLMPPRSPVQCPHCPLSHSLPPCHPN